MAKVLLVEDDNNLREIYEARLQAEGYDISAARDGEEALVVAKQIMPDLVVSDVMMPKISGFEMLDILRNTAGLEHVKVIMLTALGQSEDQSRADSLGADRYLVKSQVTLEDIVNAAHDLLVEAGAVAPDPAPVIASEPVVQPTPMPEPAATPIVAPAPVAPVIPEPEQLPAEPVTSAPVISSHQQTIIQPLAPIVEVEPTAPLPPAPVEPAVPSPTTTIPAPTIPSPGSTIPAPISPEQPTGDFDPNSIAL